MNHVITVTTPESSTVTLYLVIGYSSESSASAAYKMHYTEHLTWLNAAGGKSTPANRHSNAWTTNHTVGYWVSGPAEDLSNLLQSLFGVFKHIDLARDFAKEERNVIKREYDFRQVDNISAQAATEMNAFLYKGNADAQSAIGTPEQIASLDYDAARRLHDLTHRPENATLLVIGNVSDKNVQRALIAAGPIPKTKRSTKIIPPEIIPPSFTFPPSKTRLFTFDKPKAVPSMIWRKVVTLESPVNYDLLVIQTAILRDILDANLPGGLAGPLRFDAFITREFSVGLDVLDEHHIELQFSASPDSGVSFAHLQQAFEAALSASAKGVPPRTWKRMRKRFKTYWPDWEKNNEVNAWITQYVLARVQNLRKPLKGNEIHKLDAQLERKDVNNLLQALNGPGRTAVAFIGKDKK